MAAVPSSDGPKVAGEERAFGGTVRKITHVAPSTNCEMTFNVFVPSKDALPKSGKFPVVFYLAGLTCTPENFTTKAGAFGVATKLGLALVMPDTSPRGDSVADDDGWDLGKGAGFYVTATQEPWAAHYNMYGYITKDLPEAVSSTCPELDISRASIMGHSMGGHGALITALKNPGRFAAVSAFAPICNPCTCPWGHKAFGAYFGDSESAKSEVWPQWDACELAKAYPSDAPELKMLVSQGTADGFLKDDQLQPEALKAAVESRGSEGANVAVTLCMETGYTHGYHFIATFVEQHLRFHAEAIGVDPESES